MYANKGEGDPEGKRRRSRLSVNTPNSLTTVMEENVDMGSVLSYNCYSLSDEISLSYRAARDYMLSISKSQAPMFLAAGEYEKLQCQKVATKISSLDELLDGGLPVGQMLELYGLAGSGKTQLLMSIAARVLSSEDGHVFWYDTERTLHPQRFKRLCEKQTTDGSPLDTMLSRMQIKECDDLLDLLRGVEALKLIPFVEGPSLVVIDSIAAAARCTEDITLTKLERNDETTNKELMMIAERQSLLNRLAVSLKEVAILKRTAVIVSNHVTADFASSKNDAFKPALGLTWGHALNYQLLISRFEDSSKRCISLTKSSYQLTPRSVIVRLDS